MSQANHTALRGGETEKMIVRINRSQDKNGNGVWVASATVDGKRRRRTFAADLSHSRSVSAQQAALDTVQWLTGSPTVSDKRRLSLSAQLVIARYSDSRAWRCGGSSIVLDFDTFDETVRFQENTAVTNHAVSFL